MAQLTILDCTLTLPARALSPPQMPGGYSARFQPQPIKKRKTHEAEHTKNSHDHTGAQHLNNLTANSCRW